MEFLRVVTKPVLRVIRSVMTDPGERAFYSLPPCVRKDLVSDDEERLVEAHRLLVEGERTGEIQHAGLIEGFAVDARSQRLSQEDA